MQSFIKELFYGIENGRAFEIMLVRAVITYFVGILLMRINRRFMGLRTAFNFVLFVMLGSLLATGITGQVPFLPNLISVFIIVLLNWLVSISLFYLPSLERLIKGNIAPLVIDGEIQWNNMRRFFVTSVDLMESLRVTTGTDDLQAVKRAYLEQNGVISFTLFDSTIEKT